MDDLRGSDFSCVWDSSVRRYFSSVGLVQNSAKVDVLRAQFLIKLRVDCCKSGLVEFGSLVGRPKFEPTLSTIAPMWVNALRNFSRTREKFRELIR